MRKNLFAYVMKFIPVILGYWLFCIGANAAEPVLIRLGVQATGTLAWELAVLQNDAQFKADDFRIETQLLANAEAGKIALQSGAVDMIVSDWIWVSRLRADGADFTFYPYSTMAGALMVPQHSAIQSIKDLQGKRLGIAGGELDKNWLLLQALAQKNQFDLNSSVEKIFGAPPLIDQQLKQGRVDAALNYWHFAAKLESQGYRQILDGKGLLQALGIKAIVPSIGYVFKQEWATSHKPGLQAFLRASAKAKNVLCTDENTWQRTLPVIQTSDKAEQDRLRQGYCEGEIKDWGAPGQQAAEEIYGLLRTLSNNQLTGKSEHVQPGTFWFFE
jgi:NitT/TauT family transport system substrate-binding protein